MENQYDLIIIGAGPGGYPAAAKAADNGLKVAVIEKNELGGVCLNKGCIPTKALLHAADVYKETISCSSLGLSALNPQFDPLLIHARKNAMIQRLRSGIEQLFKSKKIALYRGYAKVLDSGLVEVTDNEGKTEKLSCDKILIACGAAPAMPPINGIDLPFVNTSDTLLTTDSAMPKQIVIIGGGVIGMEFAGVYNAFGCQVTVIEALDRILPTLDEEISSTMSMIMKKRGVKLFCSSSVIKITDEPEKQVIFSNKKGEASVPCDMVLVATGRKADATNIFADDLPIKLNRGAIVVNENFATNIEGVYAIGDAVYGSIQLAHASTAQGLNIIDQFLDKPATLTLSLVPACVYSSPEIASVGLTEAQAKAQGIPVAVGKSYFTANGKALITEEDRSFIKLIYHAETDVLLGAQLICARATDMISEFTQAIACGLTKKQMASVIRPHPTYNETVHDAIEAVK